MALFPIRFPSTIFWFHFKSSRYTHLNILDLIVSIPDWNILSAMIKKNPWLPEKTMQSTSIRSIGQGNHGDQRHGTGSA